MAKDELGRLIDDRTREEKIAQAKEAFLQAYTEAAEGHNDPLVQIMSKQQAPMLATALEATLKKVL